MEHYIKKQQPNRYQRDYEKTKRTSVLATIHSTNTMRFKTSTLKTNTTQNDFNTSTIRKNYKTNNKTYSTLPKPNQSDYFSKSNFRPLSKSKFSSKSSRLDTSSVSTTSTRIRPKQHAQSVKCSSCKTIANFYWNFYTGTWLWTCDPCNLYGTIPQWNGQQLGHRAEKALKLLLWLNFSNESIYSTLKSLTHSKTTIDSLYGDFEPRISDETWEQLMNEEDGEGSDVEEDERLGEDADAEYYGCDIEDGDDYDEEEDESEDEDDGDDDEEEYEWPESDEE